MRNLRLQPSTQFSEADWLAQRLRFSEHRVASIVPDKFPAYIRILHPAAAANGNSATWAEVAVRTGRIAHPLAQFHAIARLPLASNTDLVPGISPPESGNLSPELLKALCVLSASVRDSG